MTSLRATFLAACLLGALPFCLGEGESEAFYWLANTKCEESSYMRKDFFASPYDTTPLDTLEKAMSACRSFCDREQGCKAVNLMFGTEGYLLGKRYCYAYNRKCTPKALSDQSLLQYLYEKPTNGKKVVAAEKLNVWTGKSGCSDTSFQSSNSRNLFLSVDNSAITNLDEALIRCHQKCYADPDCTAAELFYKTDDPRFERLMVCTKYTEQNKCIPEAKDNYHWTFLKNADTGRWVDNRACTDKLDQVFWEGDHQLADFKGAKGAKDRDEASLKASCAASCRRRTVCAHAVFIYTANYAKCASYTSGCTVAASNAISLYFSPNVWREQNSSCNGQGTLQTIKKERNDSTMSKWACQKLCDEHPRCSYARYNAKAKKKRKECVLSDDSCDFTSGSWLSSQGSFEMYMARGDEFDCRGTYPACTASCADSAYIHLVEKTKYGEACAIAAGTTQACSVGMGACTAASSSGGDSGVAGDTVDTDLIAILYENGLNAPDEANYNYLVPGHWDGDNFVAHSLVYEVCPTCDQIYFTCGTDISTFKLCKDDSERPDCSHLTWDCGHKDACGMAAIMDKLLDVSDILGDFADEVGDVVVLDIEDGGQSGANDQIVGSTKEEQCSNYEASLSNQDCVPLAWKEWGACSASCGGGTKKKTREVWKEKMGTGKDCVLEKTTHCNVHACDGDGPAASSSSTGAVDGDCAIVSSTTSGAPASDFNFNSYSNIRAWCVQNSCTCEACAAEWKESEGICKIGKLGDSRLSNCNSYWKSYDLCNNVPGCKPKQAKNRLKCKGKVNF